MLHKFKITTSNVHLGLTIFLPKTKANGQDNLKKIHKTVYVNHFGTTVN